MSLLALLLEAYLNFKSINLLLVDGKIHTCSAESQHMMLAGSHEPEGAPPRRSAAAEARRGKARRKMEAERVYMFWVLGEEVKTGGESSWMC